MVEDFELLKEEIKEKLTEKKVCTQHRSNGDV